MAEFLIKNFDSHHPDQAVDDTLERTGDIVEVRPDGFYLAYQQTPGGKKREFYPDRFLIVKVPGLSYENSLFLMEALIDDTDPENPVTIKRRKYTIEDALVFLGPYHIDGNVYEVPVHSSWNSFIKVKEII